MHHITVVVVLLTFLVRGSNPGQSKNFFPRFSGKSRRVAPSDLDFFHEGEVLNDQI